MVKNDKPDYTDIHRLTKMVEEAYRVRERAVRRMSKQSNWREDRMDYDALHMKRRAGATVEITAQVMARVASFCPNIPGVFYAEEEWANINASTFYTYDNMEDEDTLTLAAAIWMLDRIKDARKLHDAIKFLPDDDGTFDEVYLPDVWDSCHGYETLQAMVYAIQQRNADCTAHKKQSRKQDGNEEQHDRFFMDDYTAADIHRQQAPSRERFEALISLIPQQAIDRAVKRCEEKMWDWVERYFRCRAILAQEEYALDLKTERFYREAESKARELKDRRAKLEATMKSKKPALSPLLMQPSDDLLRPGRSPMPSDVFDALGFMERITNEEERLDNAREALSDKIADFQHMLQIADAFPQRTSLSDFGEEFVTIMDGFSVDDPYEICFGMLYLIDQGSDLPWTYFMGLTVLNQARIRLPWYIGEYDEAGDSIWNDVDICTDENIQKDVTDDLPSSMAVPEMPDWFCLDYVDQSQDPLFRANVNLAQIFYELTGAIMPRNLNRYYPALRDLSHYGIKGKKVTLPLLYCMALAGEAKRQSHDYRRLYADMDDYGSYTEAASADVVDTQAPATVEQLQADMAALKKENERLNHALYNAGREVREAKKQHDAQEKATESQRRELADLRALIFNRNEGAFEDDTPSDPSISFPYETTNRVLVFGGHDSWLREFKPRLPGVRCVDKDAVPDVNLLRNADIIWIQTNCISHKQYDKIMSVARGRDIPVRYFSFASAVKCAEQVVLEDQNIQS